jgi:hypothetical protein
MRGTFAKRPRSETAAKATIFSRPSKNHPAPKMAVTGDKEYTSKIGTILRHCGIRKIAVRKTASEPPQRKAFARTVFQKIL